MARIPIYRDTLGQKIILASDFCQMLGMEFVSHEGEPTLYLCYEAVARLLEEFVVEEGVILNPEILTTLARMRE